MFQRIGSYLIFFFFFKYQTFLILLQRLSFACVVSQEILILVVFLLRFLELRAGESSVILFSTTVLFISR